MAVSAILPAKLPASSDPPESLPTAQTVQCIVLTGFMGSGKTTVGRLLADRLGWVFADLDAAVEFRLGLSVPQVFACHGEAAFRTAEVAALRDLLHHPRQVIALGGGAPGTPALRELLREAAGTIVVHLRAPFPVLYERCRLQARDPAATDRPLLGDPETAARRYEERLALYLSIAHCTAETGQVDPDAVADDILRFIAGRTL